MYPPSCAKSPFKDITNTTSTSTVFDPNSSTKISRNHRVSPWSSKEDEDLKNLYRIYGSDWEQISKQMPSRSLKQCINRWTKYLDPNLVKGFWQKEEDEAIIDLVKVHGPKSWNLIAKKLNGRTGKQCRERWHNHLDPNVNKGPWTCHEEKLIIDLQRKLGNKWAEIAKKLPGRTDNAIKNHWNSTLKKHLNDGSFKSKFDKNVKFQRCEVTPCDSRRDSIDVHSLNAAYSDSIIAERDVSMADAHLNSNSCDGFFRPRVLGVRNHDFPTQTDSSTSPIYKVDYPQSCFYVVNDSNMLQSIEQGGMVTNSFNYRQNTHPNNFQTFYAPPFQKPMPLVQMGCITDLINIQNGDQVGPSINNHPVNPFYNQVACSSTPYHTKLKGQTRSNENSIPTMVPCEFGHVASSNHPANLKCASLPPQYVNFDPTRLSFQPQLNLNTNPNLRDSISLPFDSSDNAFYSCISGENPNQKNFIIYQNTPVNRRK